MVKQDTESEQFQVLQLRADFEAAQAAALMEQQSASRELPIPDPQPAHFVHRPLRSATATKAEQAVWR